MQGYRPFRSLLNSGIDMFERETLDSKPLLHGTVIYRPQVTHVKGNGIHGNPARFQPCLVCDHQIGIHIVGQHISPFHEPYEAVEGGGVGLTGPYLAQALQAVYDLPHEDGERQAVMSAVKGGNHVVGRKSPPSPFQGCDDTLQPVGILHYLTLQQ